MMKIDKASSNKNIKKWQVIALTVLVVSLIFAGGLFYYNSQAELIEENKHEEIKAISKLKINQLVEWRNERINDIKVISQSQLFADGVDAWLKNRKDESLKNDIRDRLELIKKYYKYDDIIISSLEGENLMNISSLKKSQIYIPIEVVKKTVQTMDVALSDLYISPLRNEIHYDVAAPIINGNGRVIAVLIYRADPNYYLYPLIQEWPTKSKTAETLIFRQEGDSVLFLNELHHLKNTAMKLKIALTETNVPAVKAILGQRGIAEGDDYRNVKVLSYISEIQGTPWFMIAKIDSSEIYSELKFRAAFIIIFALFMLFILGIGVAWIYSSRQKNIYRTLFIKEKEYRATQEKFKTILYSIGDAVITTDANGNVQQMNTVAEHLTGWSEEEAEGKSLETVFRIINEKTKDTVENPAQKVLKEGKVVGLANHTALVSKNGKEIPIADSGAPIKNDEGKIVGVVLVFRDQSNEYAAQKSLEESEIKFRRVFENSPLGKSMTAIDGTLNINKAFCDILGYTSEELHSKNWKEITYPDDIKESEKMVDSLIKGKSETANYQKRYIHKSGRVIWTDVTTALHKDNNGNPMFFITTIQDITERIEAEQKIIREKNFNDQLINSVPGLFYQISPEGKFIKWNKNFEAISGYSSEEMAQISPLDLFGGDDKNKIGTSIQKVFTEGEVTVEADLISKDKSQTPYYFTGKQIKIDEQVFLVGMGIDISRRKKMEIKLQESEAMFKNAFSQAAIGRAMADASGKFIEINKGFSNILGYSKEEFLEMSWPDITTPEFMDISYQKVGSLLEGKEDTYSLEQTMLHKNGSEVWVNLNVVLLRDSVGKPTFFIGDIVDLTEAKKAAEERDRFFNVSLDLLAIAGTDGYFKRLNPAWKDTLGYEIEELLSKPFLEFIHPDDIEPTLEEVEKLKDGRPTINFVNRYKHKNGSFVWLNWVTAPFGNTLYTSATDITELKIAEEERLKLMKNLERSNQELEQFAYVASHDLQEPLRMVASYTQLLEKRYKDKLDDDAKDFIHYAVDGANRMQVLINDLLQFSRVSTRGKEFENVDLNVLLGSAIVNIKSIIDETGAVITHQELPELKVDTSQITRLFQNLIVNAIKYKGEESPRIVITVTSFEKYYQFAVKDNGIGIAPQFYSRIFEIFERLHAKGKYEGTGIGLAVCKRIVERHGGKIWVESVEGKGSEFYFTIDKNL